MAVAVRNKNGTFSVLLNPAEKGRKYAFEMKNNVRVTNGGKPKTNKYGEPRKLSKQARAYRAGYIQARKDNAKCFKAKNKKVGLVPYNVFNRNK